VHSLNEAEVEAAFGLLPCATPFSVEPILDPVFMINFGNISELGESVHQLVNHNRFVGKLYT